jgi:hypothetical protein
LIEKNFKLKLINELLIFGKKVKDKVMHNISTIYRFNTPFLNLENEKKGLLSVIKKIEKSIEFD